ncbi:MAG: hypothetical protein OXG84_03950 [Chloroflexi bacterium]|nr:hypothetical protein [Chloroflexota bacterium]
MPTWIDEWTVLYVLVLTVGYIVIFTFLDRYNRRKKDNQSANPSERQQ